MKRKICLIISMLMLVGTYTFAQTTEDTTLALAIRKKIPSFSFTIRYTFDKKKFELNQDSAKLYQLVTNKVLTKDYLYDHRSAWDAFTGEEYKHTDKRKWEKYIKNKSDVVDETGYWCNISTYASALGEWKTFQKTGNCKDSWRDLKEKGNKISKIGNIIVTETNDPSYLPWHPTILPSEILVGYASSDCWRTSIALRYKKPRTEMRWIPDSLVAGISPDRLKIIGKLINDPLVQFHDPIVSPAISMPDLKVSSSDTLMFFDFDKEDSDRVSIYYDGNLIQESIILGHKPYEIPVKSKVSLVEIVIEDEGSQPPCTLKVVVNRSTYLFSRKVGEHIKILRQ